MKKKAIVIVSIIIALLIIGIVSAIIIINTNNKNKEEFDKQTEIHNRYIKISEKINSIIDDSVKPIEEVINKDIGEDKTKIDELNTKKEEILKYKIKNYNKKINSLNKLKEENKKIEKSLNNIDEKLINLKDEEIENYTISEESQINVLSNEITKLIEEVNTLATKQAEKKAQEEIKAKEIAEKQAYVGTYKNQSGTTLTITMSENGQLTLKNNYDYSYTLNKSNLYNKGNFLYNTYKPDSLTCYALYPSGTSIEGLTTDTSKIRIMYYDLGIDNSNVYYKQ